MYIIYRLEAPLIDNEEGYAYDKGTIITQETLNALIATGWYEIKVTVIVPQ